MKLNLAKIIFFAKKGEKLQSFYVDILKLEILEELKFDWLLLKGGNCKIGLHKIGDQYRIETRHESGFNSNTKIVFEIDEDIHKIREQLLKANVTMREV